MKKFLGHIKDLAWDLYYFFTEGFYCLCLKMGFWNAIGLLIGLTVGVLIGCNIFYFIL